MGDPFVAPSGAWGYRKKNTCVVVQPVPEGGCHWFVKICGPYETAEHSAPAPDLKTARQAAFAWLENHFESLAREARALAEGDKP